MKIKERYEKLLIAIEKERAQEEKYYRELAHNASISDKVKSGIAWHAVDIIKQQYTIGELVEIIIERTKNVDEPHKLKTGIGCVFYQILGERTEYRGTISFVRKNKMGIILNSEIIEKNGISEKGILGVEMIYDERPYKVMKEAINEVIKSQQKSTVELREAIAKKDSLSYSAYKYEIGNLPAHLNKSQKEGISKLMNCGRLGILHGPPGTGKTTTIAAMVRQLLQHEKRILVCAPSNNAVDLLASKLDALGINVSRIGNVTRIHDQVSHITLNEKLRAHDDWQHIKKVKIEAAEARKIAGTYKRKFNAKERADRNAMYKESRELNKWARELEQRLVSEILHSSQVICSTLIGARHNLLEDINFDTLIIDEASQALEPECWAAILKAKRVILVGDHKQLPPTVKSNEAITMGLEVTLLDRMSPVAHYKHMLDTQYRMNNLILQYSNETFYEGKLQSAEGIGDRRLTTDDEVISWIDTSGCGFDEQSSTQHRSKWNEGEYFILREHFLQQKEKYEDQSIGIISPYAEQVRYIRSQVAEDADMQALDITVDSIDGFQGQEKDIIYLSLVRSNENGEIGFLKDLRRLNVALTRARMKLVIIGDVSTLSSDANYLKLLDHVEQKGLYQSGWEYMSM